jgi:hypothetical protein
MKTIQALFIVVSLTLSACGTGSSVARPDPTAGQLALSGGQVEAREQDTECEPYFEASDFQHGLSRHCRATPEPKSAMVSWVGR